MMYISYKRDVNLCNTLNPHVHMLYTKKTVIDFFFYHLRDGVINK